MSGRNNPCRPFLDSLTGSDGFSKVVRQNGKTEHDPGLLIRFPPFGQFYERVAAVARMNKNVPLWMPGWLLRCPSQGGNFREVTDPIGRGQKLQPCGGDG